MTDFIVSKAARISGQIRVPGDKSVSHRAVMLGCISEGETKISNFLAAEDCLSTIRCFQSMGAKIEQTGEEVMVRGMGPFLKEPPEVLDAGNSGTTARLMLGILAGQQFSTEINGDSSLRSRPMGRVTDPLQQMGAVFKKRGEENKLPLIVKGGMLKPITYNMPVASAQVKSAVLLAGLYAEGKTTVKEPYPSRDHTERMLKSFGVDVETNGGMVSVNGPVSLSGCQVRVPGDISSAAFFMVAAAIIPGAGITIKDVGINSTRSGIIHVLKQMGVKVLLSNETFFGNEPVADIYVEGPRKLNPVNISGELVPKLIDEIPVLAVATLIAGGTTVISEAGELRVKESDRITALAGELTKLGGRVEEKPDGLIIYGGYSLTGNVTNSHGDHRLAMAMAIAGLVASGETTIKDAECINISYPTFRETISSLVN